MEGDALNAGADGTGVCSLVTPSTLTPGDAPDCTDADSDESLDAAFVDDDDADS